MSNLSESRVQSLSHALRRSVHRTPDKTALIFQGDRWSYQQFDIYIDELAQGLIDLGVKKGDRIAILARNSHAFLTVRFAVARIAAIIVPINVMLGPGEVAYILEHSGARFVFADDDLIGLTEKERPATVENTFLVMGNDAGYRSWKDLLVAGAKCDEHASGEDLLQIVYTSGTESRPKGAMLTHAAVLWEYQSCLFDCEWRVDDITLHALPLFHCAALDLMAGPALTSGASGVIISKPTPDNICEAIETYAVTSLFAPPTVWISILRSEASRRHDLSSLVKGYYGASIMPVAVIEELAERLPDLRLWNVYGQTEIAPLATLLRPEEHDGHLGSAGRAALHVQTRVVDDEMSDVKPGEIGEIVHQSPQLLSGYWNQPDVTAKAFEGGWFHSGDLATIDSEGYITIVDRKKDMIKSGGENVSSREVEEVIYKHPKVSEVAVIGVPDPHWIEAVCACVVTREGDIVTEDEILAHCTERLAGFKRPKRVYLLDELPKNASGKIVKRELRTQLTDT